MQNDALMYREGLKGWGVNGKNVKLGYFKILYSGSLLSFQDEELFLISNLFTLYSFHLFIFIDHYIACINIYITDLLRLAF